MDLLECDRVYDYLMRAIAFVLFYLATFWIRNTKKQSIDFGPCSEEDQGELEAEEEKEMDADSSVDVPEATGG